MPWILMIFSVLVAVVASADRHARMPMFAISVIFLIMISAIRHKTGYDFDSYVDIYREAVAGNPAEGVEWGWIVVNGLVHLLVGSAQGVFLLTSVVIYGLIAWVLYSESKFAALAILAFLLNVQFYWESLAMLRQYVAIAICLLAARQWLRGKWNQFFAFLGVAALFHATAAVCLVIPVLAWWRSRWLMLVLATCLSILISSTLAEIVGVLDLLAKYQSYFDGTIEAAGEITSGLVVYARALVALLLIILVDRLPELEQRRKNLVVNGVVLAYALFFALYESTALRRVAYYFFIYELLMIGYIARHAVRCSGISSRVTHWGVIVIYLVLGTVLLAKDVWTNPLARQEDSLFNYEYRTILE
jgi:transmembrane protein EpsG